MNKLLTILSINLLLIPNICFGFDSNCFFKAAEDIPAEFIYLSKNCQAKIIAYVDKDGPVKEPIKGDCNREPFECRVGDTLSKCMPCAASSAYLDKFLDFKDKYTELCQANKENILETACNEIFSVSTKKSTSTKQAYSPESISAPVFNSANSTSDFSNTPSMLSTDKKTQQQYQEQIAEPTNQAIDLCEKSGGDWENHTCNCEKYGMKYNNKNLRCEHPNIPSLEKRSAQPIEATYTTPQKREAQKIQTNDVTTIISVSVSDHYDSSQKIKDIEICYENIESCKKTAKNGTITFTHNHLASEKISPKITVKTSTGYHCDTPINITDTTDLSFNTKSILGSEGYNNRQIISTDDNSFSFVVKCKKLCTDKDLKNVPNATKCYVRGKKDYEILRCASDYTNIDNKCEPIAKISKKHAKIDTGSDIKLTKTSLLEENQALLAEQIEFDNRDACENSKSNPKPTWDGTECICQNKAHVFNYNNGLCEELKTSDELCTDSGGKWKKKKATCDCPKNKNYNPTTRKCEDTKADEICEQSGGKWTGKKCTCDKSRGLKENKETRFCECENSLYEYNSRSKKCVKTAQDIAINNEFDRENRIERLRNACENSGGSYDLINEAITDSYICNCNEDQTYNTKSEQCECNDAGLVYNKKQNQCIKPEITMEKYQQIESDINNDVADATKSIETQCPNENTDHPCDKKAVLIQEIKKLADETLKKLKELGQKQYE